MSNSFAAVIKVSIDSYTRGRAVLPKKLANEAINHFKDNWRKQGFDDSTVKKWESRKGMITGFGVTTKGKWGRNNSRAILVKKGTLKKNFFYSVEGSNRAIVVNPTPYGVYHNYGTKKLPQRKFMGKSRNLDEKSGVLIMRIIKGALR
jgi:phage gpG-like protein